MKGHTSALVIDVYDYQGEKLNTIRRRYDAESLASELAFCVENEGIPVVRLDDGRKRKEEPRKAPGFGGFIPANMMGKQYTIPETPIIEPPLTKARVKVDNQELTAEGTGGAVITLAEMFLRAILPGFEGENKN